MLLALAVFLCGWSLSSSATVTGGGRMGAISWDYERMMNQTIRALNSPAGIAMDANGVVRIGYAGKRIGQIAMTETAAIGLGDIAAVAARSVNPAMIALMVGTLAVEGLQRCMQSQSGWCKPGQVNKSQGDAGFNGQGWSGQLSGGPPRATGDSPQSACQAVVDAFSSYWKSTGFTAGAVTPRADGSYYCPLVWPDGISYSGAVIGSDAACVSGYVQSGGKCVPDPSVKVDPVPVAYPDVAAAWNRQMAANPMGLPDYWHAMTPDEQAQASANAQNQPAQINGSDTVSDPAAKTSTDTQTKPDGTTETCTTTTGVRVQARPNTSATAGDSPLNYQGTTTTTRSCPSTGTTTTTNGQDSGDTGRQTGGGPASGVTGGGGTAPKVELKTCGLADTGPCKIDESGTASYAEPAVAKDKMDTADTQLKSKLADIGQTRPDQFGIGDVVKPLQGTCSSFSYALPKATGVDSMDIDICPTIDATRDVVSWVWLVVSALVSILLVRDAINGA
ncbi:hypothetical protein AB0305_03740 [Arthrobacter sp. NPDC080086]|uniref:hypothetical protein n=1 Tax=Arthrobacter sp. NPDC080086 TaxID=3155917 RepID=UPI00344C751F